MTDLDPVVQTIADALTTLYRERSAGGEMVVSMDEWAPYLADALRAKGHLTAPSPTLGGRLIVLVNDDVKMSRGKRCAQAIHAALLALGVPNGRPVVVLGGRSRDITQMPFQIRDAGVTELAPGTLTAGARLEDQ